MPAYDAIRATHYRPAFAEALTAARADHRAGALSPSPPSFAHVIEEAVVPDPTRFLNETSLVPAIFVRSDQLHRQRTTLGLDLEQMRLLDETHKRFVRAGAALATAARARVVAINAEMAAFGVQFGQKLLAEVLFSALRHGRGAHGHGKAPLRHRLLNLGGGTGCPWRRRARRKRRRVRPGARQETAP